MSTLSCGPAQAVVGLSTGTAGKGWCRLNFVVFRSVALKYLPPLSCMVGDHLWVIALLYTLSGILEGARISSVSSLTDYRGCT